MDASITDLIAIVTVAVGLAAAYAQAFGPYQVAITQAIIDALNIPSRYRAITNLVVGVVIGVGITAVGAAWLHTWDIVPVGVFAGVLASVKAGQGHDAAKPETTGPRTDPETGDATVPVGTSESPPVHRKVIVLDEPPVG